MIDSLYIAATGLVSNQSSLDTIANNLANMNTTAFKKARVNFRDLYSRELSHAAADGRNDAAPSSISAPSGITVSGTQRNFALGEFKSTGNALDWAIQGSGFFEVVLPDGSSAYTRTGEFRLNADGQLVNADGYPLRQGIDIPEGASRISVDATGVVSATLAGATAPEQLAQLELTQFNNPGALDAKGSGLFVVNEKTGDARIAKPGEEGLGTIAQGFIETSNVQLNEELLALMVAQRGYEASSKIIQASDEILGIANNLRR